jgi:hypothetical protein
MTVQILKMKKFAILLFLAVLPACKPEPPTKENIREVLRRPENLQEFSYADFGPPLFTYMRLGKPMPFDGVVEKEEAGWKVGNISVLVLAESYMEPQLIFLQEAGLLKPEFDYRVVWYYEAINTLDDILADPQIPENMKDQPRKTREKIFAEMGSDEEVRQRISEYRDPLEEHVREHNMHPEIRLIGEKIMEKGQSR